MIISQCPSKLRVINLLIPPSNDPLLTPYQRKINPKIIPLKKNFSILSNTKRIFQQKEQKLQLSKNDIEKINRSYQSLKKFKKTYLKETENQQNKQSDPSYLNLIQLRKSILLKKKAAQKQKLIQLKTTDEFLELQSSFIGLTQPKQRPKTNRDKNRTGLNKQQQKYLRQGWKLQDIQYKKPKGQHLKAFSQPKKYCNKR